MATTGTADENWTPDGLAGHLRGAPLARVVSRADGDGLAAAAILGRALAARNIPRHLSLSPTAADATTRISESGTAVALGFSVGDHACNPDSAALCAYAVARELGTEPDPGLAIAGAVAADVEPHGPALDAANERGLEHRPGLAIPTADPAVGLAHTGLVHADFSGSVEAAGDFLGPLDLPAELDADANERLASAVALAATDTARPDRATRAIEAAIAPRTSPTDFETVEGYADVLNASAAMAPGQALAALLGTQDRTTLRSLWEQYGTALHRAVEDLSQAESPVATGTVEAIPPRDVARLGRDFHVDADRLYVAGTDAVALATSEENARERLETAFPAAQITGTDRLATVRAETDLETVLTEVEPTR
ncbi:MAG: exonuclease [Halobacteriota archaeon]